MDQATRYYPLRKLDSLEAIDMEATRVREDLDWWLAAFIAVFDPLIQQVLIVQLGDYARAQYGGNPWTLPGGSVDLSESPTVAIARELREETGQVGPLTSLKLAGWFPRPYYRPHHRHHSGELLLFFAGISSTGGQGLHPSQPETIGAQFHPFNLLTWLKVPSEGCGDHPLQPLPKHWSYWTRAGQVVLKDQARQPLMHTYNSHSDMWLPRGRTTRICTTSSQPDRQKGIIHYSLVILHFPGLRIFCGGSDRGPSALAAEGGQSSDSTLMVSPAAMMKCRTCGRMN